MQGEVLNSWLYGSDERMPRFHYYMPLIHDEPFSQTLPFIAVSSYLVAVYLLPKFISQKSAARWVDPLLPAWNLFLFLLSVFMFFGLLLPTLIESPPTFWETLTTHWPEHPRFSSFILWIFAISKYFELIDTVFLILRSKSLPFLHVYHHATVLCFSWYVVYLRLSCAMTFALVNTFVHSFMYGYYYLTAKGFRPRWGAWVTRMQMVQMVIGMTVMGLWAIEYSKGRVSELHSDDVFHAITVTLAAEAMYASYLGLFMKFYIQRFGKESKAAEDLPSHRKEE